MSKKTDSNKNIDVSPDVKVLQFLWDVYSKTRNGYVSSRDVFRGVPKINKKGILAPQPLSGQYHVSNTYAVGILIEQGLIVAEVTTNEEQKRSPNVKWCSRVPDLEMAISLKKYNTVKYPSKPKPAKVIEPVAEPVAEEQNQQPHLIELEVKELTQEEKLNLILENQKRLEAKMDEVLAFVNS
jgi:hypothetical protein